MHPETERHFPPSMPACVKPPTMTAPPAPVFPTTGPLLPGHVQPQFVNVHWKPTGGIAGISMPPSDGHGGDAFLHPFTFFEKGKRSDENSRRGLNGSTTTLPSDANEQLTVFKLQIDGGLTVPTDETLLRFFKRKAAKVDLAAGQGHKGDNQSTGNGHSGSRKQSALDAERMRLVSLAIGGTLGGFAMKSDDADGDIISETTTLDRNRKKRESRKHSKRPLVGSRLYRRLRDVILKCDYGLLKPSILCPLLQLMMNVSDEEVSAVKQAIESIRASQPSYTIEHILDTCVEDTDVFIFHMSEIPNIRTRLECMIFESTFDELFQSASGHLDSVYEALGVVERNTEVIARLFQTGLAVGNKLNVGSRAPILDSFPLSTLDRLSETRSSLDPKWNALHFMIAFAFPESASALNSNDAKRPVPSPLFSESDISILRNGSGSKTHRVRDEVKELVDSMRIIKDLVSKNPVLALDLVGDSHRSVKGEELVSWCCPKRRDLFFERMQKFYDSSAASMADLCDRTLSTMTKYKALAVRLGDVSALYPPPKEKTPDSWDLIDFCLHLDCLVVDRLKEVRKMSWSLVSVSELNGADGSLTHEVMSSSEIVPKSAVVARPAPAMLPQSTSQLVSHFKSGTRPLMHESDMGTVKSSHRLLEGDGPVPGLTPGQAPSVIPGQVSGAIPGKVLPPMLPSTSPGLVSTNGHVGVPGLANTPGLVSSPGLGVAPPLPSVSISAASGSTWVPASFPGSQLPLTGSQLPLAGQVLPPPVPPPPMGFSGSNVVFSSSPQKAQLPFVPPPVPEPTPRRSSLSEIPCAYSPNPNHTQGTSGVAGLVSGAGIGTGSAGAGTGAVAGAPPVRRKLPIPVAAMHSPMKISLPCVPSPSPGVEAIEEGDEDETGYPPGDSSVVVATASPADDVDLLDLRSVRESFGNEVNESFGNGVDQSVDQGGADEQCDDEMIPRFSDPVREDFDPREDAETHHQPQQVVARSQRVTMQMPSAASNQVYGRSSLAPVATQFRSRTPVPEALQTRGSVSASRAALNGSTNGALSGHGKTLGTNGNNEDSRVSLVGRRSTISSRPPVWDQSHQDVRSSSARKTVTIRAPPAEPKPSLGPISERKPSVDRRSLTNAVGRMAVKYGAPESRYSLTMDSENDNDGYDMHMEVPNWFKPTSRREARMAAMASSSHNGASLSRNPSSQQLTQSSAPLARDTSLSGLLMHAHRTMVRKHTINSIVGRTTSIASMRPSTGN